MHVNMSIKSKWGEEKKVLQELSQFISSYAFLEEDWEDLKTALAEACLNAMEHGNNMNPDLPVQVHVTLAENTVTVDVRDQGFGFSAMPPREAGDLEGHERGWGLLFINNLVDDWYPYNEDGTFGVRMIKKMRARRAEEEEWKKS